MTPKMTTTQEKNKLFLPATRPVNPKYDSSHLPLEVIYHDQHIVIVNKPYGLLSVPGFITDSAETRVADYFGYAQAAHRLDMATSGLIVIAITPQADASLKKQFRERDTTKAYRALVHGKLQKEHGFISLPLGLNWLLKPRQRVDFVNGKNALTEYQVLHYDENSDLSYVHLIPHTGRTHQLRVHMAAIGHAIWGDKFYDDSYKSNPHFRMCLHSTLLGFEHPITGQQLEFQAIPEFFTDYNCPDYIERRIIFDVANLKFIG